MFDLNKLQEIRDLVSIEPTNNIKLAAAGTGAYKTYTHVSNGKRKPIQNPEYKKSTPKPNVEGNGTKIKVEPATIKAEGNTNAGNTNAGNTNAGNTNAGNTNAGSASQEQKPTSNIYGGQSGIIDENSIKPREGWGGAADSLYMMSGNLTERGRQLNQQRKADEIATKAYNEVTQGAREAGAGMMGTRRGEQELSDFAAANNLDKDELKAQMQANKDKENSPVEWAKNNPWKAGAGAVAGGYMLKNMFFDDDEDERRRRRGGY